MRISGYSSLFLRDRNVFIPCVRCAENTAIAGGNQEEKIEVTRISG